MADDCVRAGRKSPVDSRRSRRWPEDEPGPRVLRASLSCELHYSRIGLQSPVGGLPMRLAGKIGIVTAAASGMGRAGALRFAREGAQVAVVDVDAAGVKRVVAEITAAGGVAHGITADLTKDDDSRRIVWDAVSRFKGLDFVWNHVGHPGPAAVEGIVTGVALPVDGGVTAA